MNISEKMKPKPKLIQRLIRSPVGTLMKKAEVKIFVRLSVPDHGGGRRK
jgi:hypothetical protein